MEPVRDQVDHAVERDSEHEDDDHRIAFDAENLAGGAGAVNGPSPFVGFGVRDAVGGLVTLGSRTLRNPKALAAVAPRTVKELAMIGLGRSTVAPDKKDKRFRDEAWQDGKLRKIMQLYLTLGA